MSGLADILKRLGPLQVGDKMTWVGNNYSKADLRADLQVLEAASREPGALERVTWERNQQTEKCIALLMENTALKKEREEYKKTTCEYCGREKETERVCTECLFTDMGE